MTVLSLSETEFCSLFLIVNFSLFWHNSASDERECDGIQGVVILLRVVQLLCS